jgi:hypothetical protein
MKPLVKLVKTGNIDVESVMVLWTIQSVIFSCRVARRSFPVLGQVCIHKLGWVVRTCPEPLLKRNWERGGESFLNTRTNECLQTRLGNFAYIQIIVYGLPVNDVSCLGTCEKRLLASTRLSVRPSTSKNSAFTGWVLILFDNWLFFESVSRKFKFHLSLTRITDTWNEDQYLLFTISRSILLTLRSVWDKGCRKNQNVMLCAITFFSKIVTFICKFRKILYSQTGHKQYGARALNAGYLKLQRHNRNV